MSYDFSTRMDPTEFVCAVLWAYRDRLRFKSAKTSYRT